MSGYIKTISLGISLLSSLAVAQESSRYSEIFTLERTQNANQVVYEADLTNVNNPIHPYWKMLAQDGHIEELNGIERSRAYGVNILEQSPMAVKFVIVSFKSHPITVQLDPVTQLPYATITLDVGEKILTDVFLTLGGGFIPSVKKIDVSYQDVKNGPILHESIDPNLAQ